jgi:cbb3-type cytochrome oxidase subunit 3
MLSTIITIVLAILLIYVIWVNYSDELKYELGDAKDILQELYSKDGAKAVLEHVVKPLYESLKGVGFGILQLVCVLFAFVILPTLYTLNAFVKVHVRNK